MINANNRQLTTRLCGGYAVGWLKVVLYLMSCYKNVFYDITLHVKIDMKMLRDPEQILAII